MNVLATATATASQPVGNAVDDTLIVGSGMIETAPIAVKWWLHMAAVSSSAPQIRHFIELSRSPTGSATAPRTPPSATEATTSAGAQTTMVLRFRRRPCRYNA